MHDAAHFERLGLPAAALCSSEFQPQAGYQARMLGYEDIHVEFVQHPIADATHEEIERKARGAFEGVMEALTSTDASVASRL